MTGKLIKRAILSLLTLSLFLSIPVSAMARWELACGWPIGTGIMGTWVGGWFGMIIMMLFWILIIVGLVYLIKWLVVSLRAKDTRWQGRTSAALDILKERYARGQIDLDEFERRRRVLED